MSNDKKPGGKIRQSQVSALNAAVVWASRILLMIPQLILVPFMISRIGKAGFGVYALVWSVLVSIDRITMSLQSGVVKYGAGYYARGRLEQINKLVSTSFVYSAALAALACTGTILATFFCRDETGEIIDSLLVIGVSALLIVPIAPYSAVVHCRQRHYITAVIETVLRYLGLAAVLVWFVTVEPSIQAVVIIMSLTLLLSRIAQVPVAHKLVPGLHNRLRLFDLKTFRLMASFGAVTVFIAVCLSINTAGIRWLMKSLESESFVAELAIMLMPCVFLSQITNAATITVMPATSAYEALDDRRKLREFLIRGTRYTTVIVLAAVIVARLLMRDFLRIWVGPEYESLARYAILLFVGASLMESTSPGHHMLKGLGRLRMAVSIYVIGLVLVPFSVIPVVFVKWGNPHVAVVSGLVAGYLVCGFLQVLCVVRAVNTNVRSFFMRAYMQPLLVGVVVLSAVFFPVYYELIQGFMGRIIVSVAAVSALFGSFYVLFASKMEKKQVKRLVRSVFGSKKKDD